MGFSGTVFVGRVDDAPSLKTQVGGVPVIHADACSGGWSIVWLDGNPEVLHEVVRVTGAPVLEFFLFGSDAANVEGSTPAGTWCHTHLHAEVARQFGFPPVEASPDEVVARIVAWSTEAGLTADPDAVGRALAITSTNVEETLYLFLSAVGIVRTGDRPGVRWH